MRILESKHNPIEIYSFGEQIKHPKLENLYHSPALKFANSANVDDRPKFTKDKPMVLTVEQLTTQAEVYIGGEKSSIKADSLLREEQDRWIFWKLHSRPGLLEMSFADKQKIENLSKTLLVEANVRLITDIIVQIKSVPWLQIDLLQSGTVMEDWRHYIIKAGYLTNDRAQPDPTRQLLNIRELNKNDVELRTINLTEKLV